MKLRARYRRIVLFFARVILALIWWELILPWLGFRSRVQATRAERLRRIAADFRALATQLGGVLIKVGQFLSARVDVLPPEVTSELSGLQDAVAPEPFAALRQLAEAELRGTLAERFVAFEEVPLASASLGQAHRAQLSGEISHVVVKIQRPNIEAIVATDLAALRLVGNWLHRYPPLRRRVNIPALLNELSHAIFDELDYIKEGHSAETFAANFQARPGVLVPRVIWTHTTRRVLTLEDVSGIKITDYDAITAAGVDRAAVARRLADTYLKQIFEDGFFHADPHPGNLFVRPQPEGEWQLTFVDFGMALSIPPGLRPGFREAAIAIATRDAKRLIHAYQLLDLLLPNADLTLIEKAEQRMFEVAWGKTMEQLRDMSTEEMEALVYEFRELFYELPFQVPQNLILLGRALALLSGLCTGLDPCFNLWATVTPYAEHLLAEDGKGSLGVVWDEVKRWGGALVALPVRVEAILGRLERGELEVRVPQLTYPAEQLEIAARRLIVALIFTALLISGTWAYISDVHWLGEVLLVSAALALICVIFVRREP